MLLVFRLTISTVLLAGLIVVFISGGEAVILEWSYLSQGLRGAAVCFPLLACIFFRDRIAPRAGFWSVVLGPSAVLLVLALPVELHPLYPGLAMSGALLLWGYLVNQAPGRGQG